MDLYQDSLRPYQFPIHSYRPYQYQQPATNRYDAILEADPAQSDLLLRTEAIGSLERVARDTGKGGQVIITSPTGAFGRQKDELTVTLRLDNDPPVLVNASPR